MRCIGITLMEIDGNGSAVLTFDREKAVAVGIVTFFSTVVVTNSVVGRCFPATLPR